jgi:hypothetical protein
LFFPDLVTARTAQLSPHPGHGGVVPEDNEAAFGLTSAASSTDGSWFGEAAEKKSSVAQGSVDTACDFPALAEVSETGEELSLASSLQRT